MRPAPLWLALGTLTAFRVPAPGQVTRRVAGQAMVLAPIAALPLAVVAGVVAVVGHLVSLPRSVSAVCVIGALALATRGMHLDGLADTADGLASGYDREKALTVMRAGDVGPAGASTLVLILLVETASLAASSTTETFSALVAPPLIALLASRTVLALCCLRGVPTARPNGLGATVAGTVPPVGAAISLLLVTAAAVVSAAWAGLPWWAGPATVLACVLVSALIVLRAMRRLGGITGDVLGACIETSFAAALLTLAVARAHVG